MAASEVAAATRVGKSIARASRGTMTTLPPTPNSPENSPATVPTPASWRVLRIAGHTRGRVPLDRRDARRAAAPAEGRPGALRRPARRRRRARPDRPAPRRRAHARDHPPAADRGRQALRRRRLRVRAPRLRRPPRGLAGLDRLPRLARLGDPAAGLDRARDGSRAPGVDAARAELRARPLLGAPAAAARAPRGQGGDRRPALARRARRGGGGAGHPRGRRGGRGRRLQRPLGPQGARDPPARAHRQGRGDRLPPARHGAGRRGLRRRRHHGPRRLPRARRARRGRLAEVRAARGGQLGRDARRARRAGRRDGGRHGRRARPAAGTDRVAHATRAVRRLPQGHRPAQRRRGDAARGADRDLAHARRRAGGGLRRCGLVARRRADRYLGRAPRRGDAADRAAARRRAHADDAARAAAWAHDREPPVAAAALDVHRGGARVLPAAGGRGRRGLRDHLGARLAAAGVGRRRHRGARRRALLRRPDLAGEADPARAHARVRRHVPAAALMPRADVLIVSLGGTAGLREADAELAGSLRRAGAEGAGGGAERGREGGSSALIELAWARAARGAARAGIAEHRPRAVLYSSTTAALLAPRPGAIRFDAPAAGNRPGRHGIWQRPVERRRLAAARLLVPWSEGGLAEAPEPHAEAVVVPVPVAPSGEQAGVRDIAALTYGANPEKKGLDRVLAAWAAARRPGEELVVAGVDGPGVSGAPTDGGRFAGMLPRPEYRALLRRARVFVCAPRREDYGIAQLEALVDGCLLVTTPSPGPYAAMPLARVLDPRLGGGVAEGLRTALDAPSPGYAQRAREALAPWAPAAVAGVLAERFLPRLQSLA